MIMSDQLQEEIETLQSVYSSQEMQISMNKAIIIQYAFTINEEIKIVIRLQIDDDNINNTEILVKNDDIQCKIYHRKF